MKRFAIIAGLIALLGAAAVVTATSERQVTFTSASAFGTTGTGDTVGAIDIEVGQGQLEAATESSDSPKGLKVPKSADDSSSDPETQRTLNDRFIVQGDFPEDQLAERIAEFEAGKIEAPYSIKLDAASDNEILSNHLSVVPPAGFNDRYCPYNETKNEQCGGGPIEKIRHTQCTYNPVVSFYENCNYGNFPNVLGEFDTLHPKHPSPRCTTDSTPACACRPVNTPPCGVVLRLFPPGCDGCCRPLPVSCEQCCKGSAWLYDTASNGCSCGEGP